MNLFNFINLPVREEDDTFDSEELENWIVRSQKVFCGKIEEEESIQRHWDAEKRFVIYMIEYIWSKHMIKYMIHDQSSIKYIIKIEEEESNRATEMLRKVL